MHYRPWLDDSTARETKHSSSLACMYGPASLALATREQTGESDSAYCELWCLPATHAPLSLPWSVCSTAHARTRVLQSPPRMEQPCCVWIPLAAAAAPNRFECSGKNSSSGFHRDSLTRLIKRLSLALAAWLQIAIFFSQVIGKSYLHTLQCMCNTS